MTGRRIAVFTIGLCIVTAGCDSTEPLPPAVFVAPQTLTLEDGQTVKLTATLRNPRTRTVTWSSSNPSVASVDVAGNVTGVTNGTASVVVRMVDDTSRMAAVSVTVIGPPVASVLIAPVAATVYVGAGLRLAIQLRAADGRVIRGRALTWSSSDPAIADVTTQGLVRGRGPGGPISVAVAVEGRSASTSIRVAHSAQGCPFVAPAAFGARIDGSLTFGDCEFPFDESYVDIYEFTLASAAIVQVDMASAEVDSYLGLFAATGAFLAQDDNSGGGMNARIVASLEAGRYRIWVNTTKGGVSGAYALTLSQR